MKQYVLYGQVQQRLNEHALEYGKPFGFYDAVAELWQENKFITANELPIPPFKDWDISRVEDFCQCMKLAPVDLEVFLADLLNKKSALTAMQRIPELNILPLKMADNQSMGLHIHDAFELLYVIRGNARLNLNEVNHVFSEGELCIISPHFLHDVIPDNGAIVVSIEFWTHAIEDTLFKLLKGENAVAEFFRMNLNRHEGGYLLFMLPVNKDTLMVVKDIFREGYSQEEYAREMCTSYIEILFSQLLRYHAKNVRRNDILNKNVSASAFLSVLKYIQANYRNTSLRQVAELFHYEPDYLGRRIKQQTGKNYSEIINDLRLGEATRLLAGTSYNVEQVAETAGFKSREHFSRSFKVYMGMSPGEYRKQNRSSGRDN